MESFRGGEGVAKLAGWGLWAGAEAGGSGSEGKRSFNM